MRFHAISARLVKSGFAAMLVVRGQTKRDMRLLQIAIDTRQIGFFHRRTYQGRFYNPMKDSAADPPQDHSTS